MSMLIDSHFMLSYEESSESEFYVYGSLLYHERTGLYEAIISQGEIPVEKQVDDGYYYDGAYLPRYSSWILRYSTLDSNPLYALEYATEGFIKRFHNHPHYDGDGVDMTKHMLLYAV